VSFPTKGVMTIASATGIREGRGFKLSFVSLAKRGYQASSPCIPTRRRRHL